MKDEAKGFRQALMTGGGVHGHRARRFAAEIDEHRLGCTSCGHVSRLPHCGGSQRTTGSWAPTAPTHSTPHLGGVHNPSRRHKQAHHRAVCPPAREKTRSGEAGNAFRAMTQSRLLGDFPSATRETFTARGRRLLAHKCIWPSTDPRGGKKAKIGLYSSQDRAAL